MTRPILLAFTLAATAALGIARAEAAGVYLPPADGFKIGQKAMMGRRILVEMVPRGETVKAFTRMISLQTMPDMAKIPEPAFIAEFARRYIAGCPGASATAVPLGGGAGGVRIDCSRHPATGKAETVFARALHVGPDMGLVHITMTYLAMPAEAQWARDYLGRVHPQ